MPDTLVNAARPRKRDSQRGVSLLFALLALAAMLLAAVALVRSVDSGALVLGNLGFKQEATSAADIATEVARGVVTAATFPLTADGAHGSGYYATSQDALDPTGRLTSAANPLPVVDWGDSDSCACRTTSPVTCASCTRVASDEILLDGGKVRARYLITRLCPATGDISATNACAKPAKAAITAVVAKCIVDFTNPICSSESVVLVPYYRLIVRTVGARGSVSFTETIMY